MAVKSAQYAPRAVLGGVAIVCCVHDREKRKITTESQVAALGLTANPPQFYDRKQHKLHLCSCCENLFVDPTDIPRYCHTCRKPPLHVQRGPLPIPEGVVG